MNSRNLTPNSQFRISNFTTLQSSLSNQHTPKIANKLLRTRYLPIKTKTVDREKDERNIEGDIFDIERI